MIFKKTAIFFLLILFLFPIVSINAQNSKAGFAPGNIWYSKDPFYEGDKIEIYAFIFNPENKELSGTVVIFDNTIFLGKKDFVLSPKAAKNVYINWTVTAGDHNIFAKIEDSKFKTADGKYERVYLAENETEKNSRTVAKTIVTKNLSTTKETALPGTVENIKKVIEEKTPAFILEPIISTTDKIEAFRINAVIVTTNKKEEVKKEIKVLGTSDEKSKTNNTKLENENSNSIMKPFKYVELFLLSLSSFILNNKVIFYGLIIFATFFIFYFIWKKIF